MRSIRSTKSGYKVQKLKSSELSPKKDDSWETVGEVPTAGKAHLLFCVSRESEPGTFRLVTPRGEVVRISEIKDSEIKE